MSVSRVVTGVFVDQIGRRDLPGKPLKTARKRRCCRKSVTVKTAENRIEADLRLTVVSNVTQVRISFLKYVAIDLLDQRSEAAIFTDGNTARQFRHVD